MMKIISYFILVLFVSLLNAKEVNSDQVKAAYVYNFLKHTTWPNESSFAQYHLLVASQNENLKNMFLMLSSRKLLNDKKIKVTFYDGRVLPKNIQAVYIDEQNSALYEKIFNTYEPDAVLLISDGYKEKQKVMINLFQREQMVTFEINKANILNRSLKISPDLVLLGGSEIDVAKLYKSSQHELREQKETIGELNKKIKERNGELSEKMAALEKQKAALQEQKSKIELQSAMIAKQLQSINEQKNTITAQEGELQIIHNNIDLQKERLLAEEKNIKEKENELSHLLKSYQEKQREITDANNELKVLNTEIETQKENLVQKEGIISTQRGAISALLVLFGIIVLLVVYVFKQNRLLNALSQTDLLTGLFNRRALIKTMQTEIQKYHRYETPFTILFIDVDHFKSINDSYGHDKGDRVLKIIASLMNQQTRETDVCVRWGGEEFMILATNTPLEEAVKLAENFRSSIEAYDFQLGRQITISIGLATMKKAQDKETLIKTADNALYIAKESGRNTIRY